MSSSVVSNRKASFAKLARDIDWQRSSFLFHCLEIVRPSGSSGSTSDFYDEMVVRKILDDYLLMAALFYQQFRADLADQYKSEDGTIQEEDVKVLLQRCLSKLITEWHRVYSVILAIRADKSNAATRKILKQIQPVLTAALNDLYLQKFGVILQFGQSYSLRFSNYMNDVAVLNVPIMALESPWEWTILWHELAGEKIRILKNKQPNFFSSRFDRVMHSLNKKELSAAEDFGWSVEWFEEMFEDTFSLINFPIQFLQVFKNLLERYPDGGKENRHPFRSVRLAVGMSLHLQMMGFNSIPERDVWNTATWKKNRTATPIALSDFSEFDPTQLLPDLVQSKVAWLMAQEFLHWHDRQSKPNSRNNSRVKDLISDAISRYSIFSYAEKGDRANIFKEFSSSILGFVRGVVKPERIKYNKSQLMIAEIEDIVRSKVYSKNQKHLSTLEKAPENVMIKKLIRGGVGNAARLNYTDLLKIPFDDVDYLITHIKDVSLFNVSKYQDFDVFKKIDDHKSGNVTYTTDKNIEHRTTRKSWNDAADVEYQLK